MESFTYTSPLLCTFGLSGDRQVTVNDELGRGTCSIVYCGQITGSWGVQRTVAVKVLENVGLESRPRVLAHLTDAVERAARVHHPHVAQTYDFDLQGPQPFVVNELVDGGSLESLIDAYARKERQIPQELAILIAMKVASGLAGALEAVQLVHGSLATRDVLVSWSGEVKITDFGFYVASPCVSMVRPIDNIGRIAALAPEVACGAVPDPRSDVFSMGILLHELLLGQRFSPHTSQGEALALVREGIVHRSLMEPQLVHPLRAVVRRCLERDPMRRYAHAGEVAAELRKIAVLLGIPDVPAYIGNAVEEIFAPPRIVRDWRDTSPYQLEETYDPRDAQEAEIYDAEIVETDPPSHTSDARRFADRESSPTIITRAQTFEDF